MIDPDLARAIDQCQASLLQDAAADEADPVARLGWAWLLERRAWPTLAAGRWTLWPLVDDDLGRLGTIGNWYGMPPGEASAIAPTASACLADAATAIGQWLQQQEAARPQAGGRMTSPPSAPCEACGGTGEVQGKDSDDVDLCWACRGTGREGP